jgi:prepilin-type N-terminal cleavage/methylation domain-containing protein
MKIKNKKGMTLMEAMIAIAIFAIGVEGFTLLFSRSLQQNAYIMEMGQTSMAVSRGVNELVRYIREAQQSENGSYPVVSADDNDLIFYSDYDRDGRAERLHFYKSGTDVIMGTREPNLTVFPPTYAAGDGETKVVASNIINDAGTAIFSYYDSDYPEDSVNNPITTPANVPDIRLVRVRLHMNIDPNNAPDNVLIQSFAEMRNLNDHDRFGL